MKAASGELSLTVITIIAIAAIMGIMTWILPKVQETISSQWNKVDSNVSVDKDSGTISSSGGTKYGTK